jgi:hypothetical protein
MRRQFSRLTELIKTTRKFLVFYRVDLIIAFGLMALAGSASYVGSGMVNPVINSLEAFDVWFDSDAPRVFDDMRSRLAWNLKADVHPLFALFTYSPVYLLRSVFQLDDWIAVRVVIALLAALWMAALFVLLRCIGLRRYDAILFSFMGAISASAVFWFVLPETHSFGSLTMLLALIFVSVSCYCLVSPAWTVAVNAMTLSMTISCWVVGLLSTLVVHTKKKAIEVTIYAICFVGLLSSLQLLLFPRAIMFGDLRRILSDEPSFFLRSDAGTVLQSINSLIFHSIVMPEIKVFDPYWNWLKWKIMRVQLSDIGSGTSWGLAAIPVWCVLLGLGIWGLLTVKDQGRTRLVLACTILSQLGFHTFFGREPFLYSLHIGPLLVVLAAFGALTPQRHLSLVLAVGMLVLIGINNAIQFSKAIEFFHTFYPPIHRFQSEMELPVADRKPDFQKTVAVSVGNNGGQMKGYLGPGGSFSPGENSFGLSIWAVNRDDIITTTDTFWPPGSSQGVSWKNCGTLPVVETKVHYFNTKVEATDAQTWKLSIEQGGNFITSLVLAIRSAGPSGGRIYALNWDGHRLIVNDRWILEMRFKTAGVQIGEEQSPGRFVKRENQWKSEESFGYALFELPRSADRWEAEITEFPAVGHKGTIPISQGPC